MTDQNTPNNQVQITWNHQPIITVASQDNKHLSARLTPAQTAALIKKLATYLATWHRTDINLTDVDSDTDPAWHPPTNTESDR